jgi:predicted TIM-barrel fold metal-dependent hydrolase
VSLVVIDAHVTAGANTCANISPEALLALMDQHGVNRAVLSPVDQWLAVENREGNDTLLRWIQAWPDRFLGYATANPWYGQRAVSELERALALGLHGVKLHPARQGFMLLEQIVEPLITVAAHRRIPVYVVTGVPIASMPLQLAELARRFPDVPFIMGRSGRTDFALDLLPAVQQAGNIYVETVYNPPSTLAAVIKAIGPERMVFASDAPVANLRLEVEKLDHVPVDSQARAALMGGTIARLLRMSHEVR